MNRADKNPEFAMIQIEQLRFRYGESDFELAIDSLRIDSTSKVAVVGPSGSGKTTLLNLIAGIEVPHTGRIVVAGTTISDLPDAERRDFRIRNVGLVFQQFELVNYLSALDNILLPFYINPSLVLNSEAKHRARQLATTMGMEDKLARTPDRLSQGEQQRIAICRALVTEPQVILADEPTGNLDPKNKTRILDLLFQQASDNGQTLVVVTHDLAIVDGFDNTIDFETLWHSSPGAAS